MTVEVPEVLNGKTTTSVGIAASVIGIGRNQAYAAVRAGTIPSLRIGGRLLVPVQPLLAMLGLEDTVKEQPGAADRPAA